MDYEKAYDDIDRASIWELVKQHGITQKTINLIKTKLLICCDN